MRVIQPVEGECAVHYKQRSICIRTCVQPSLEGRSTSLRFAECPAHIGREGRIVNAPVLEVIIRCVLIPVRDGQVDGQLSDNQLHSTTLDP